MVIEFEVKKQCHRIIKMAKLRSHCTCWDHGLKTVKILDTVHKQFIMNCIILIKYQ